MSFEEWMKTINQDRVTLRDAWLAGAEVARIEAQEHYLAAMEEIHAAYADARVGAFKLKEK